MSADQEAGPALRFARVDSAPVPGDRPLLGVDLEVQPGELCVGMGLRGSGLMTLLALAAGRGRLLAGEVEHADPLFFLPDAAYLGTTLRVGELPEGLALEPGAFDAALVALGLPGIGERLLGGLPEFALQRVALAAALAAPVELLVLTEPFEGLDLASLPAFLGLLEARRGDGQAQLLGCHGDPPALLRGASALLLEGGRVRARQAAADAPPEGLGAWARQQLGGGAPGPDGAATP